MSNDLGFMPGAPPTRAVGLALALGDAALSLRRHSGGFVTLYERLRPLTAHRYCRPRLSSLRLSALPSPSKVPAVQRKSPKQAGAASMPDTIWTVSRSRPDQSRGNITPRFRCRLIAFDT